MLPIYLSEPCNEPARHRTAATIARRTVPPPDVHALAGDRQRAARHIDDLINRFAAALAERGIVVSRAATAAAAADRVAALAAGTPVAVTRAAVLGELHPALTERGITTVPTYGPGTTDFVARHRRFWQLPPHAPSTSWRTQAALDAASERRDIVGLFGVNAVSATTGTIYLLQHSSNIGELLRTARLLIFVVAVDKIAGDDGAAQRQVEAVGTYGTDSVLLDLARTRPRGDPLERFPPAAGALGVEVILLDNGRTDLLRSRYRELFTCIGCRACATRCPTYPEFRGPRGWSPKDYLWSHLCGDNPSLDLCTLCGNCEVDCPVDIPLPTLIAQRRAEDIATHGRGLNGWRRRLHGAVERLDKAFSATAPLSNYAPRLPLAATVMDRVFGLAPAHPLPAFRRDTFERWHARRGSEPSPQPSPAGAAGEGEERRPRVVYYFGCFTNYNNPEVGQATVQLLEALGYDVTLPEWRCCGVPLYAKGEIAAARRMVEFNVAALAAYIDAGCEIVTSCPSCQLALARDYPRLFPSEAAERVAAHTHFLSRFLLDRGGLEGHLGPLPQRAAYHLPCHLRALGMDEDTLRLLHQIPGFHATAVKRGCCGLSGTFGLERDHYAQSMDTGSGLFAAVKEGECDMVLTDCGACKLQIEHGTGRQVTHPLQVLCRAVQNPSLTLPVAGSLPRARSKGGNREGTRIAAMGRGVAA